MKKVAIVVLNLFLSLMFLQADMSLKTACVMMKSTILDASGIDLDVTSERKGNVYDFNFECSRWYGRVRRLPMESQKEEILKLYGAIIVAVGIATSEAKWKSDKAWVLIKSKPICYFYTKDCRRVVKLPLLKQAEEIMKIRHPIE